MQRGVAIPSWRQYRLCQQWRLPGRIIASGPDGLPFNSTREPGKLLIDPQMTLLCVIDR
jgi:hypothetical protein